MAYLIEVLGFEPGNLSLIPRTHTVMFSDLYIYSLTHLGIHTQINVKKENNRKKDIQD